MRCNQWKPEIRMHFVQVLWALWALVTAQESVPCVSRSHIERPHKPNAFNRGNVYTFSDSHTLMFYFERSLQITFDSGRNWQTVDVFGEDISWVDIDEFYKERAFVTTTSGEIHMTEDQGRSWKQLSLPQEIEDEKDCVLDTHPFNTNLLLLHCIIIPGNFELEHSPETIPDSSSFMEDIAYASADAGKSFRRISAPFEEYEATQDLEYRGTTCQFATLSKESIFDKDGIYCMHQLESRTEIQKQSSHPYVPKTYTMGTLFYTTDLGQSTKLFDELEGFSVKDVSILPFHVLVTTSEANEVDGAANRLWVSTGGPFKPACLPKRVAYLPQRVRKPLELDPESILLRAILEEDEGHGKFEHLLLSDSSGLNFSLIDSIAQEHAQHVMIKKLDNLEGAVWGEFIFREVHNRITELDMDETKLDKKVNWFQRIIEFIKKHILHRVPYMFFRTKGSFDNGNMYDMFSKTKGSFDNGKTWTNLKVVDPSGTHKHIFQCDIDDVENCSFQEVFSPYFDAPINEPTAGILMETGVVGKHALRLGEEDNMTFISRDGGSSWEVVFEFPVSAAFLDFGNIIVAVPESSCLKDSSVEKFFYSLDQGNNWREYYLDELTHASNIVLDGWGLNVVIGLGNGKKQPTEYTFYTVDFSEVLGGSACTDNDWEKWYLSDGKCFNGVKYSFNRRKADAQCLMRKTFEELTLNEESCEPRDIKSSI
ncbi:hypothetical protein LQ764DRAFT_227850 [Zygosaccharomyces rouxii]|nr:hypothetical protein LQ764DRAFT_227850 [Zygosaccharomyces rouxii]